MLLLIGFAFLAGIITILSPCILPVLPIILSGTVGGDKRKPFGIVLGFIFSFTIFTLFLSAIVKATGIQSESLRIFSTAILLIFGIALFFPSVLKLSEKLFSSLQKFAPKSQNNNGFIGGFIIGLSLGLLWTPCVGPILASVITLAATSSVNATTFLITLAYSLGTAIPMFAIMYGGRTLFTKVPWLLAKLPVIQRFFGVLMILTALSIFFKVDIKFQAYIVKTFPQYGAGLTKFEYIPVVQNNLNQIQDKDTRDKAVKSINEQLIDSTFPLAPEIIPGGQWFNSKPLSIKELRGKVVLVDFWTYTCINCIRTLPYLHSWNEKYADKGLVIIGVHSPEFEFEKNPDNLQSAIKEHDIKYPVVQDNDFATWNAFTNRAWPAKYLIDKDGRIRYVHEGEGGYDDTEKKIQELLAETGVNANMQIDNPNYNINTRTPETYLGYSRIENLTSPEDYRASIAKPLLFSFPKDVPQNKFAYSGIWTLEPDYGKPEQGSKLKLNFDSQNVFLVMRPEKIGQESKVKVLLDGEPISSDQAGQDVKDGIVTINQDRLYTLVKLARQEKHLLTLEFLDGFVQIFAFTFG